MGVKGPSALLGLQDLDIVDGFVDDYMHCVDLGVTRSITALWLDSANHCNAWYIGCHLKAIKNILANIHSLNCVTRLRWSLCLRKYWKASEWRAFTLYYGLICLRGILPYVVFYLINI